MYLMFIRLRSRAERMCKKLEKKLELLRGQAEEDAAVGESASKEVEKLKKKVADLKEQLLNLVKTLLRESFKCSFDIGR